MMQYEIGRVEVRLDDTLPDGHRNPEIDFGTIELRGVWGWLRPLLGGLVVQMIEAAKSIVLRAIGAAYDHGYQTRDEVLSFVEHAFDAVIRRLTG